MTQGPLPVVVNRSGGTASAKGDALSDELERAFAASQVKLDLVAGKEMEEAIDRYRDAVRVVVGGGDGTLGSAAGLLAGFGTQLGVLPLGTRNHFARQLGIPIDLEAAAHVSATGRVIEVDLGDAGGRTFINNASFGAYVELVREREKSSLPKWIASIGASWRVLRKLRPRRFNLVVDGEAMSVETSLLFVGNNRYQTSDGKLGDRAALDEGVLSVFALARMTRWRLVTTAARIALGKIDDARDFSIETTARELRIDGDGEIGIALDGELTRLPLPLTLTIRPLALKVVVADG